MQQSDSVIYIYIHIYIDIFLFIFFPLWFITGYWIWFPVLYSRTLFISFLCSTLYLLISNSQFIPTLSPLVTTICFLCYSPFSWTLTTTPTHPQERILLNAAPRPYVSKTPRVCMKNAGSWALFCTLRIRIARCGTRDLTLKTRFSEASATLWVWDVLPMGSGATG